MMARLRARVPAVSISFPSVLSHTASLRVIDHPIGVYLRQAFEIVGLIPNGNGPGKPNVLIAKRIEPNP